MAGSQAALLGEQAGSNGDESVLASPSPGGNGRGAKAAKDTCFRMPSLPARLNLFQTNTYWQPILISVPPIAIGACHYLAYVIFCFAITGGSRYLLAVIIGTCRLYFEGI
jgi:hypothetical protein